MEFHSRRGHAGPAHGFELLPQPGGTRARGFERHIVAAPVGGGSLEDGLLVVRRQVHAEAFVPGFRPAPGCDDRCALIAISAEIGSASCWERGCTYVEFQVVAVSYKKKK